MKRSHIFVLGGLMGTAIFVHFCNSSSLGRKQFEITMEDDTPHLSERLDSAPKPRFVAAKITPAVINTWGFSNATAKAWEVLNSNGGTALDAVEQGCTVCEDEQCDGTVGYGGSPDENGETTLDAMIMDGPTHKVGAVAGLRRIKNAIGVARKVLEHTKHTFLVGDAATDFAKKFGFKEESLTTSYSEEMWQLWKGNHCQPNFWLNVVPDPITSCGPYQPTQLPLDKQVPNSAESSLPEDIGHDTIGMITIDQQGRMAAGTSTNGARHKIPGRVGDSPMIGSGAYVDQEIGGAAATGDGDILMRFLPSFVAVENMKNGMTASAAAKDALQRIAKYNPEFSGAVVTMRHNGEFGAACYGFPRFQYSVANPDTNDVLVLNVSCLKRRSSLDSSEEELE